MHTTQYAEQACKIQNNGNCKKNDAYQLNPKVAQSIPLDTTLYHVLHHSWRTCLDSIRNGPCWFSVGLHATFTGNFFHIGNGWKISLFCWLSRPRSIQAPIVLDAVVWLVEKEGVRHQPMQVVAIHRCNVIIACDLITLTTTNLNAMVTHCSQWNDESLRQNNCNGSPSHCSSNTTSRRKDCGGAWNCPPNFSSMFFQISFASCSWSEAVSKKWKDCRPDRCLGSLHLVWAYVRWPRKPLRSLHGPKFRAWQE